MTTLSGPLGNACAFILDGLCIIGGIDDKSKGVPFRAVDLGYDISSDKGSYEHRRQYEGGE